jgi:LemA protein
MSVYIPVGVLVLLLLWAVGNFNALVRLRQHIRESWRNIDVQLKRRYELIPNLVQTVKGYATHERELLERVVQARNAAREHDGEAEYEQPMVASLRQHFALAENYPELKADRHFLALQEELVDTEDRIAAARRFYNGNVRDYNSRRESFPSSIIAGLFGFSEEKFWKVDEVLRAPEIKL